MKRFSCFFLLIFSGLPLYGQNPPFGERIRETPPAAAPAPEQPEAPAKECEFCGRPTLFGFKRCFHCMQKQAPHDFKSWVDQAFESTKKALEALKDPKLTDAVINKLLEAKRHIQDRKGLDSDYDKAQKRQGIQDLGKIKIGPQGREINELAREAMKRYLPVLEGTDYADDPVKTLSYFLILDGKGFIENVKCVRGPMGEPMTLLEAYQFYSGSDPQKAKDLLEIIDNVRKLSNPEYEEESVPLILDTLGRSLRVLTK